MMNVNTRLAMRRDVVKLLMVIEVIAALLAAGFWFASAKVSVPPLLETTLDGPNSITEIMKRQSRLSGFGAMAAAVAAIIQTVEFCFK